MIQEMDTLKLSAQKRAASGTTRAKRLRQTGLLPCVVYDSTGKSVAIQLKRHTLELLLHSHEGQNIILDLEIEGDKTRKVLLKDTQRDHIKDHLLHADFLEISMTRKLKVAVAVRLIGEPVGVSQQGGVMEHIIRSVEVECLPADIIKEFTLDVSALSIGDTLCVRDIKATPELTILTAPDIAVATVQLPHIEEEETPAEEAAEAAAEGKTAAEGKEGEAPAEPGKEKEGKEQAKDAKESETKGKGKETKEKAPDLREKGKQAKDKGKETKEKGK